jgi:hypothetical protein
MSDKDDTARQDTEPGADDATPDAERRRRDLEMATTLPGGTKAVTHADTLPLGTSAERLPAEMTRGGTFPPVSWDEQSDVITSSSSAPRTAPAAPPENGIVEQTEDDRLSESAARTILDARFRAAGVDLATDQTFQHDDLAVVLDGYDPAKRVGYAYLSHADADVVTDFDEAAELAFQQLAADGVAHVLVLHDSDIPTADALERRIDAFFSALHRSGARP